MKVAVLGAGSFGCSIAQVLSDNNNEVVLWTHLENAAEQLRKERKNPYIKYADISETIEVTANLEDIKDCSIIVYVVPSFALRETTEKIRKLNLKDKVYVICTKGIEASTLKTGLEILRDDFKIKDPIVILSGPTHAEELALKKATTIVSTSESEYARKLVQKVFSNDYLRVYTQHDVIGVEVLGGAKNVLAIAAGICDSHPKLGDNAKAALLTRGLAELALLGKTIGASPDTFYGLTGMGDLIVTATSKHSRNRKFGELLGQGYSKDEALEKMNMVVEGLYSIKGIYELTRANNLNLPIITIVYQAIYEDKKLDDVITGIFKRELKDEKYEI